MVETKNKADESFDIDFDSNLETEENTEEILSDIDIDFDDDEINNNEQSEDESVEEEVEETSNEPEEASSIDIKKETDDAQSIELGKSDKKDKASKKDKKSKKGLFKKEEVVEKPIDLILYIVADRAQINMVSYCRNYGANVSKVFTNIAEARDNLLMQIEPFRVIVIDSGTGRFTNIGARKELIDLLGICDVDTRITVFYTDSAIKTDVELADEVEDKQIHWYKYRSTPDVVAHILQNSKKEHYILDNSTDEEKEVDEGVLNITGLSVRSLKAMDLGRPTITPDDVVLHMVNDESKEKELQGYNIKIRK